MLDCLINLLVGIFGGIYSGVIVARVFSIQGEIDAELTHLRKNSYFLGSLMGFFEVIETILKVTSDTSEDIERNIRCDKEYLRTHRIIDADNLIGNLKEELLDVAIDKICNDDNPLALKQKRFVDLQDETKKIVEKYKKIREFKFAVIDDCKREIEYLENKYENCLRNKKRFLIDRIIHDKIIIVLVLLFAALIVAALVLLSLQTLHIT